MSKLIMVRHGQAEFGSRNYDKLSELGVSQSVFLGKYWARRGQKFDAVFSGSLERQKHTLKVIAEVYRDAGLGFPEPQVAEGFNEYDLEGIMTHFYPRLLEEDKRLKEIQERTPGPGFGSPGGRKAFQEVLEIVLTRWVENSVEVEGLESWKQFQGRVISGVERIRSEYASGKTVGVFSSGGAISALLQYALKVPERVALGLGWVMKNSCITEFLYSGDMFTLTGFNMTPHLEEESQVTYR